MGPRWLTGIVWLTLIAWVHSAALPTEETLVVAKSDEPGTTEAVALSSPVATTEEPSPPIKLTEMDVRSEVSMRYAHTAVVTRVRNPARKAQEATFRVLLPETAFISGFTMILDGKSYKAYVKEKEEAKQIYSEAVSHGIGAAHIAAKARDSNHFTVSVNVEPNTEAVFNLTYEELLIRRNKVYNHAINLHPGALVPKLTVTVHVKEAEKLTELRVPEVRTGNEIDATENDVQNSKAVIERSKDGREATITFTPDLEEQKRLREIYAQKSKESQAQTESYGYYGHQEEDKDTKQEGVLGQFVVQYDVDRPENGEILVNDGYFVHFFAPSSLPPLSKHVVFVLDTSGSMMGRKIIQLREAMQTILSELNSGDYFSIVEFDSSVQVHDLKEAEGEPPKEQFKFYYEYGNKPTTLVPPSPATSENIARAKVIVNRLHASGGTNIGSALHVAVQLIQKGVGWKKAVKLPAAPLDSPALPEPIPQVAGVSSPPTTLPTTAATEATVDEVDSSEAAKKLEPIIIFLTDGDPTVGETSPKRIISVLTEENSGDRKASIFTLAFGEDADRSFLRKLSLRSDGFTRYIYEAADAALQLRDFYRQVSSPLLANVHFVYPPDQVKDVTKNKFRTFYAGSEAVVAGRVADSVTALDPEVLAFCAVDDSFTRKRYEKKPVTRNVSGYLPMERIWAYLTIKQLLDERDTEDSAPVPSPDDKENNETKKENTPEKKALAIALKYEFVTPLTSLVVVKPNATDAVDAESVDKQNNQYDSAPGGGVPLFAQAALPAYPAPGLAGAPSGGAYYSSSGFAAAAPQFAYSHLQSDPSPQLASEPEYEIDLAVHAEDISYDEPVTTPAALHHFATGLPAPPPPSSDRDSITPSQSNSDFDWLVPIKKSDASAISINVNGTKHELELSDDVPKDPTGDVDCAHATDGAPGLCVYLTRCDSARNITVAQYEETYCVVNNKYAGVCCPKAKIDVTTH